MSRTALTIVLAEEELTTLEIWALVRSLPDRHVLRARIITRAARDMNNQDIAKELGISRPTVQLWRENFLALRLLSKRAFPICTAAFQRDLL